MKNLCPYPAMEDDVTALVGLGTLPDIPLLKVFSFLSLKDKIICSQVCRKWSNLIFTPTLWRTLDFTHREGKYERRETVYYDSHNIVDLGIGRRWLLINGGYLRIVDGNCYMEDAYKFHKNELPFYKTAINQYRMLIGCLENIIPKMGPSIKNLFLNANSGLSDYILNIYLILCPNVEKLDARFTAVSGKAFERLSEYGSCRKIKELNLMGCKHVNDDTLRNLVDCWQEGEMSSDCPSIVEYIKLPYSTVSLREIYDGYVTSEDCVYESEDYPSYKRKTNNFLCPPKNNKLSSGIKFLSLAGCHNITDAGLEYLAHCKYVHNLEILDVSGCSKLTSKGLNLLAKACPRLKPYNLFYCDLIYDGPYCKEANGCQTEGGECCMN